MVLSGFSCAGVLESDTKNREQVAELRNEKIDQFKQSEQDNFKQETERQNVAPEKPVRASIVKANAQCNNLPKLASNLRV